ATQDDGAARIADIEDRIAAGRFRQPGDGRGRIQLVPNDPLAGSTTRLTDIESALRSELLELGFKPGRVDSAVRPVDRRNPQLQSFGRRQAQRYMRFGAELLIAVERPNGGGWLVLRSPWQQRDRGLIVTLMWQTLILYIVVLLPMLWAARRISRPLQTLATAARTYRPGDVAAPLDERGPQDVRAVIAAFNQLRVRVTAMLDEKDQMLGAIGHDLRTPLAALRVRIESVDDDHDRARMAETIDEMSRTLDDILSLARLGRPSEPVTEADLGALVEAVVDDFDALGADVTFAESPRITLKLRPALMRRAVRNLVENAVKYGGSAAVSIAARPTDVEIVIADHGPGIPADKIAHVFDAFTRLENSRNRDTGGAGLGLTLARAIVREAGGDITLSNRKGGGLAATIVLPRR
ncbi:MAG: HAMP domain-containing histidine kinase, partial [Sphingomonas sp.]|nr:HAMP domain-containing histidine kinase [Sphingomonas sp.]